MKVKQQSVSNMNETVYISTRSGGKYSTSMCDLLSMNKIDLYNDDCLKVMDELIEQGISVDAIICDQPYQMTACSWDLLIPFNCHIMIKRGKKEIPIYKDDYILQELKKGRDYKEVVKYFDENCKEGMWQRLNKLIKPNGAIVLFGSEPFSSALRMSNIKNFKYDWIWHKNMGGSFALCKKQPLKRHEIISVFYKKQCTYNPQFEDYNESTKKRFKQGQEFKRTTKKITNQVHNGLSFDGIRTTDFKRGRYPTTVKFFKKPHTANGASLHPTQKPVKLMEYLIKTYSNECETVLDFTMGSGSTGVAAKNTNRNFIGIEIDEKYFNIAKERLK